MTTTQIPLSTLPAGAHLTRPSALPQSTNQLSELLVKSTEPLAFSCVGNDEHERKQFVKDLLDRSREPFQINQGGAPLCGPAAFMYCVAKENADEYVRYVLSLALTGEGSLGGLKVRAGTDCRKADLKNRIHPVDWVALASLRDSSNRLWDMKSFNSSAAGITDGGTLAGWFRETGWFRGGVEDNSNNVCSKPLGNLLEITKIKGYTCLLIRSAIISAAASNNVGMDKIGKPGNPKTWLGTPDHWIVLLDNIKIDCRPNPQSLRCKNMEEKLIDFHFFHWGVERTSVTSRYHNLTVGQFLPYYYGYVSALNG